MAKIIKSIQLLLLVSFLIISFNGNAQSIWSDRTAGSYVNMEFVGSSGEGEGSEFPTFATFFSGKFRLTDQIHIVSEIPVFHLNVQECFLCITYRDLDAIPKSGISFGNPYLGFQIGQLKSNIFMEVGYRPSILKDKYGHSNFIGKDLDLSRRTSWGSDISHLHARLNYLMKIGKNGKLRFGIGPSIYTKFGNTGISIDYGLLFVHNKNHFGYMVGINGETNSVGFEYSQLGHLGASVWKAFGNWQPGMQFRIPFLLNNNAVTDANYVFGVNVRYYMSS